MADAVSGESPAIHEALAATPAPPLLSVCIATFGRGAYIEQTLEALLRQADERVEIVVVDGASPDNTPAVIRHLQERWPCLVYHRQALNAGVDRDFDKAVEYASGKYCWLFSDDDLPVEDAIASVIDALADEPELLIVNAEVRDKQLAMVLKASQLTLNCDQDFDGNHQEQLFATTAGYLSFIGGVVIRRSTWLQREREKYFGSLFIHMGVLFQQPPLSRTRVLARPLIRIRYGNALWTARGFEIWTRMWPDLVWSFRHFSESTLRSVVPRNPAADLKTLLWYRSIGAYGMREWRETVAPAVHHRLAFLVAHCPAMPLNLALSFICAVSRHPDARVKLFDLGRAVCASFVSRWIVRRSLSLEMEK